PARLVLGAFGALGAVFLLEAAVPDFPLVLGLSFVVGTPIVALDVSLTTLLQRSAPDGYRGRVFGTMGTTISLAVLAGMGLGGGLGSLLGTQSMLAIAGAIDLGFGVLALVML